jgi:hypothetical protein
MLESGGEARREPRTEDCGYLLKWQLGFQGTRRKQKDAPSVEAFDLRFEMFVGRGRAIQYSLDSRHELNHACELIVRAYIHH